MVVADCHPPHYRRCSAHLSFVLLSAVLPVHFACAAVLCTVASFSASAALVCASVRAVVSLLSSSCPIVRPLQRQVLIVLGAGGGCAPASCSAGASETASWRTRDMV